MKKYAAEHHQHALAIGIRHAHAEYRPINLTLLNPFADSRRRQSLESLFESFCEIRHMFWKPAKRKRDSAQPQ